MTKKESSLIKKEGIRGIGFSSEQREALVKKLSEPKYKGKTISKRQIDKIIDNNYKSDKYHSVTYTYQHEEEDIKLTGSMVDKMIVEVEGISASDISLAYAFNDLSSPS